MRSLPASTPHSITGRNRDLKVRRMMRRGMMELTGADDWAGAWRRFFEPGDVVGIKLNPVGQPLVKSDATIVREIIAGLEAAGVKRRDIVAYDRYRHQFFTAGYDKWLPEGVRISYAAEDYDSVQQAIGPSDDCSSSPRRSDFLDIFERRLRACGFVNASSDFRQLGLELRNQGRPFLLTISFNFSGGSPVGDTGRFGFRFRLQSAPDSCQRFFSRI